MVMRNLCGLILAMLVCACSSTDGSLPPASTQPSITQSASDYSYLIGAGDNLRIFVWGNPEVSGDVTVRPDGRITTALVEDLPAAGKTPSDLARELEKKLGAYIRDPKVTVTVSGFVGPFAEQVRVIGEAANPQAIPYRHNMTALDVLIAVGGLTPYASGNSARLVRVVDGQQKTYSLRLDDLIREGDISANVDVLPGDVIIIPEAWF